MCVIIASPTGARLPDQEELREALIGTSRLAIMERSGDITRIGKWYNSDGLWYSTPYCISGANGVQYGYGR